MVYGRMVYIAFVELENSGPGTQSFKRFNVKESTQFLCAAASEMARNVAAAAALMMKRFRELKFERQWGSNSSLSKNLMKMDLNVKPNLGIRVNTVRVELHPEDLDRVKFGEAVNEEILKKMSSLDLKPGWFQSLCNGLSYVLGPTSIAQYGMWAYGISGEGAQKKILDKLLADGKVEEKIIKSKIDKELNEIQKLLEQIV